MTGSYINKVRDPFNASMVAQKSGIAAINDIEFIKNQKIIIKSG